MTDIDQALETIRQWEAEASAQPWVARGGRLSRAGGAKKIGAFHRNQIHGITVEERAANARLATLGRNCILPLVEALEYLATECACGIVTPPEEGCVCPCHVADAALALVAEQAGALKQS